MGAPGRCNLSEHRRGEEMGNLPLAPVERGSGAVCRAGSGTGWLLRLSLRTRVLRVEPSSGLRCWTVHLLLQMTLSLLRFSITIDSSVPVTGEFSPECWRQTGRLTADIKQSQRIPKPGRAMQRWVAP
jgi:hypothetical protein